MPNHGDFDPAKGWYSANRKVWTNDPTKIGLYKPPLTTADVEHKRDEWDRMNKPKPFILQRNLERMIELRDSDRADDRAKAERAISPNTRIQLHDYETAKAAAKAAGQEIVDGGP